MGGLPLSRAKDSLWPQVVSLGFISINIIDPNEVSNNSGEFHGKFAAFSPSQVNFLAQPHLQMQLAPQPEAMVDDWDTSQPSSAANLSLLAWNQPPQPRPQQQNPRIPDPSDQSSIFASRRDLRLNPSRPGAENRECPNGLPYIQPPKYCSGKLPLATSEDSCSALNPIFASHNGWRLFCVVSKHANSYLVFRAGGLAFISDRFEMI